MNDSNDKNKKHENLGETVRLAVRSLAETVYRRGGLGGPVYGGVSAQEGQRLHRVFSDRLSERYPHDEIETETHLSQTETLPLPAATATRLKLIISGRLDALVLRKELPLLIEVKSFSGLPEQLPSDGENVHWAQAKLYGWLYLETCRDLNALDIRLCYISQESEESFEWQSRFSRAELAAFFQATCKAYVQFAADLIHGARGRRQSGLDSRFPYHKLRDGQKIFMQEVVGAAQQKGTVLLQAPTGIGKTMAALYPAVKALAHDYCEQAFYLTAMTSTRRVAAQAIDDLRPSGLRMKALILFAKEKLCLQPNLYCDQKQCPYAIAYYDHLPQALHELFIHETIGQDEIVRCATRHDVCPFELALDMALYCEIVICDYNYAFDPRVRLERFFGQDSRGHLLLVDEAHNLPERSRRMFSASFTSETLSKARKALAGKQPPLERAMEFLAGYVHTLSTSLAESKPAFDRVEPAASPEAIMVAPDFRAMRALPENFLSLLVRFIFQASQFLLEQPEWSLRKPLLDLYFAALFFVRIAESFFDSSYVTTVAAAPQSIEIQLMCLDAADRLAEMYRDRHAAVFFSATLMPLSYYARHLYGSHPDLPPEMQAIPSPFPSENRMVLLCTTVSTRYQEREQTLESVRDLIFTAIRGKTGNYLVYVPSYRYLHQMRFLLRQNRPPDRIDYMFQLPNLSDAKRQQYLERFEAYGQKTLLAFAVIGGQFSEGIDLAGEKLSGVIVVGVGMPRVGPQRDIMRQYYDSMLGQGFAHAYLFPGFNKVQQAAGRVIRSETDRGFILLIDDRYRQESYRQLFPAEWQPDYVETTSELAEKINDFWGPNPDSQLD